MSALVAPLLALVVLTNLRLLGGSRLIALIRTAALQGVLLGLLALAVHAHQLGLDVWFVAAVSIAIKGLLLPWLLGLAIRQVQIRREVEPLLGYNLSLLLGAVALGIAFGLGDRFSISISPIVHPVSPLLIPVAIFTMLTGFLLVIARRKALTQVLGYLVFENGIFVFGLSVVSAPPLLVELGVLLDLFVGVFVMGIIVFQIQRTFDHIDVDRLSGLRDAGPGREAPR